MVTDHFGSLLQELGKILEAGSLQPDQHNSCLLKLKNGLSVQLEFDSSGEFMILGCDLGDVPPGKYRENLFREALKANNLPYPNHGTLAYSKKSNKLVLFEKLYNREMTGEIIAAELIPFSEKGLIWKNALEKGEVPLLDQTQPQSSGMFGLRP